MQRSLSTKRVQTGLCEWVLLSGDHLRHNVAFFQGLLGPNQTLCAVIKADAYGHGVRLVLPELCRLGVHTFAVSRSSEAAWIRKAYPHVRIVVLCDPLSLCFGRILNHRLEPCINSDQDLAFFLKNQEVFRDRGVRAHFKVDTGMGRLGLVPDKLFEAFQTKLAKYVGTKVGIMSHFAMSEVKDDPGTLDQRRRFLSFLEKARQVWNGPIESHMANSSAVLNNCLVRETSMVRVGIGLYGGVADRRVRPVLSWQTRIQYIKNVEPNRSVGYKRRFVAQRPTRIGVIPLGYRAGFGLQCSNRALVRVGETAVPVIGQVSMDLASLDVTDVPLPDERLVGHVVTVVANDVDAGSVHHVTGFADRLDTISYEVLCRIHPDMKRRWRR